jgi:hypothetical protein
MASLDYSLPVFLLNSLCFAHGTTIYLRTTLLSSSSFLAGLKQTKERKNDLSIYLYPSHPSSTLPYRRTTLSFVQYTSLSIHYQNQRERRMIEMFEKLSPPFQSVRDNLTKNGYMYVMCVYLLLF